MKLTFHLPRRTIASSLPEIAEHIPAMLLVERPKLRDRKLEVSRQGRQILWQTSDHAATFEVESVQNIQIMPVETCGVDFVSIVLTFPTPKEPRSYMFLTSNIAEADWLIQTAQSIGKLLEMPVENRLQAQPATG